MKKKSVYYNNPVLQSLNDYLGETEITEVITRLFRDESYAAMQHLNEVFGIRLNEYPSFGELDNMLTNTDDAKLRRLLHLTRSFISGLAKEHVGYIPKYTFFSDGMYETILDKPWFTINEVEETDNELTKGA